jgi:AcrR family transcriptional regulator
MAEIDEMKHRIVLAANELFIKYGIRSVTMDDIARHLGMSKKTIYQSFSEKDEIVSLGMQMHCQMWEQKSDEIVVASGNAIEELLKFSLVFREQMRKMNPNMMFDLFKYHRATWEEWLKYKREVIKQRIIDTIDRGMAEGYFRQNLNKDILATLRVEQLELAFNDSVFPHEQHNLEDVQMQLFDHFIYGCLNRKGFDLYEETKKQIFEQEPIHTK